MIKLHRNFNLIRSFYQIRNLSKTHGKDDQPAKQKDPEVDVIIETTQNKGIITLNRPKSLNALNLPMVQKIYPKLLQWQNENKTLVIIKGAGKKAFCSGADIRAVVKDGLKGGKLGHRFFKEEYTLNGLIANYKIPYVAFIDGIVMGGGVGLSVHGKYRVATEKTVFAMPEMQIGLFPDVGATYFLPKLKGKLGYYLALTGHRLKGADNVNIGIATHFTPSKKLPYLEKVLLKCKNKVHVDETLKTLTENVTGKFSLEPLMKDINECFSANTVEGIIKRLESKDSKWANETIAALRKFSPTSLKVALKALRRGEHMRLEDCLAMEYRLARGCLRNKDFFEGVRALLIDKDLKPKWDPSTLEDVKDDYVESYFALLPEEKIPKSKPLIDYHRDL